MKTLSKKQKALFLVGLMTLVIFAVGATYAYFQVSINNNATNSTITGTSKKFGTVSLTTNTSKLYLTFSGNEMGEANKSKTYYANTDSSGTPLTSNPNYSLATASLTDGELPLDCEYNFKVTATVTNTITDNSDSDVLLTIGDTKKTLKELTSAGNTGVIINGTINNLVTGTNQSIALTSSVTNSTSIKNDLQGNSYTITIEPYNNGDIKSFSCKLRYQFSSEKTLAQNLIDSEWLWQSGLEGDGYRFTGTGVTCSYDNGNYIDVANYQSTTPRCPTLYNFTSTYVSDGTTTNYTYKDRCPSDNDDYTYSCTKLTAESMDSSNVPKNFICFGTTDKDTCTSNPSTYMYRIIGVFADENGDNHVKLIKYTQLSTKYAWNSSNTNVDWANSTLYVGLNGSYFLTNTTYSYMQDNTWLDMISNWKWTAVNTKSEDQTNTYYYYTTGKGIYLHEMNKGTSSDTSCTNFNGAAINCLGGSWTTPTAKIGLMYASDYMLSLGASALSYTGSSHTLKTGWMHQCNNDTTASVVYEWTISRVVDYGSWFSAWQVYDAGNLTTNLKVATAGGAASPALYLESDIKSSSGEGTLSNPYILKVN